MNLQLLNIHSSVLRVVCLLALLCMGSSISAQDSTDAPVAAPRKVKPVKNTFESIWLIDNQTVMVPAKKTFEMDIMHRFGTMKNKYNDFFGFFAPSNIRLGFNYVLLDNILVGASITKENMSWEGYGKYAIMRQTRDKYPVSVTYYGDVAVKTKKGDYRYFSDRLSYFNQLLIARKFSDRLSLQLAPSVSHINVVQGIYKTVKTGTDSVSSSVIGEMKHNHIAVALSGRYKVKEAMALIFNYDQPITQHPTRNPDPNVAFGLELSTSAHTFQFFLSNYYYITPQQNNLFNQNNPAVDFKDKYKQYLIGFNITRLWSY